jgi:hypothetical protein
LRGGSTVPGEPHGFPDEDAAGHHQWGGQPHKVLTRGEVHQWTLFQGQNLINKEKVYMYILLGAIFYIMD